MSKLSNLLFISTPNSIISGWKALPFNSNLPEMLSKLWLLKLWRCRSQLRNSRHKWALGEVANKQQFSRTKMQQNYIICVAAITRELWPLAREVKGQWEWQVAHKSAICMRIGIHVGQNVNMWIRMWEWIRNEDVRNDRPRSVNIFQGTTHGNPFEKFADR